jgi:outer membrane protein insertion porin family
MDGVEIIHGPYPSGGCGSVSTGGAGRQSVYEGTMKHLLWTVVLLAICAGPLWAQAGEAAPSDPNRITDVRVEGNTFMSDTAVLLHVKTHAGLRYDQRVIDDDQRRLLETGRFESVTINAAPSQAGVIVTIRVVERPVIDTVDFLNNKAFSDEDLLNTLPYGPGDPLSEFFIEADRKALVDYYQESGFEFVEVTVSIDGAQLTYSIVEGPRVTVTEVVFEGNTHFNKFTLSQRIGTHRAIWPFIKGPLDLEQVQRDKDILYRLYFDAGYRGVEVGFRVDYNDDKTEATVVFVIQQNPRYQINEIIINGNNAFTDAELIRRLPFGQGDFITVEAERFNTQAIQDSYGEVGYINAVVTPRVVYVNPNDPRPAWAQGSEGETELVNLVFTIVEEDQYFVGDIIIRGNNITQQRIIRRELRFHHEDLYNTVAAQRSKQRLLDLRLFSEVDIEPTGDVPGQRDVLVTVQEMDTGEFNLAVGVSSQSGLLGSISFTQRNFDIMGWGRGFKGAGQRLEIVAEPGTELMRFRIEWTEPYLFDQPYSLSVKGFAFERERDSYDERRFGMVTALGHWFKNRWYGEVSTRLEGVDIRDLDRWAPSEVRDDSGMNLLAGAKGSLTRDNTNSRWQPTQGDRLSFSYEQVMGDHTFGKIEARYNWYRTLYTDAMDRPHYVATKIEAGQIIGDAPVFESFYAGGINSIRGFAYRGISPRASNSSKRIGGEFMFIANAEYNFPIYGENLRGVVFVDSGTVESSFGISSYRASVGAGLRWTVPFMGPMPLKLDFAIPLVKDDDDDTQIISFGMSWNF